MLKPNPLRPGVGTVSGAVVGVLLLETFVFSPRILGKMNLTTNAALTYYALKNGLID